MPGSWPFADPENVAVFTLRRIVEGKSWVLRVCHDEEDGVWQFLDGGVPVCLIRPATRTCDTPG